MHCNGPRIEHRLRVKDQVSENDRVIIFFWYANSKLMPYLYLQMFLRSI